VRGFVRIWIRPREWDECEGRTAVNGSLAVTEAVAGPDVLDPRSCRSHEGLAVRFVLDDATLDAIAERVAYSLDKARDDGFLDVDRAAEFLGCCTRKAIYHLVERGRIRAHRVGGRLLFDRRELRADAERGE
jgi:excisionase family DNA binding protein